MNFHVPTSLAELETVEFRQITPREQYGRLVFGPVPVGQGVTLGNTFRRTLLNDLPGVAITAAKLRGAQTEFVTLPGIRESVVEIFLNLREIVFFQEFPDVLAPQARIEIEPEYVNEEHFYGESVSPDLETALDVPFSNAWLTNRNITAGDLELPPGIQCVDPTQHIATLVNGSISFALTCILEQGTGYRVWKKPTTPGTVLATTDVEDEDRDTQSGRFHPLDGNFMPVKTVNFSVHMVPPEGEYVHFEITTNGSVHPRDAFKHAAALLAEVIGAVLHEPRQIATPETQSEGHTEQQPDQTPDSFATIPIEQLELSLRAYNCLKRAQILTLADLSQQSYQSLLALRNFGQKSAEEVRAALATYGIELGHEPITE